MTTPTLNPKITDAGLALFPNPEVQGFQVSLTHVAIGTGKYNPTGAETTLANEVARYAIGSGTNPSPRHVQVGVVITDTDDTARSPNGYEIGEIGFYAGSTLFAVWSQASAFLFKKAPAFDVPIAYTMDISAFPENSVTVTVSASKEGLEAFILAHEAKADPHTQYANKSGEDFTGPVSVDGLFTAKQSLKFDGAGEGPYWGGGGTAITGDDTGGAQKIDCTVGGNLAARLTSTGIQGAIGQTTPAAGSFAALKSRVDQLGYTFTTVENQNTDLTSAAGYRIITTNGSWDLKGYRKGGFSISTPTVPDVFSLSNTGDVTVATATGARIIASRTSNVGGNSEPGYFDIVAPNASGTSKIWARIKSVVTDATNTSEDADLVFMGIGSGSLSEKARIDSRGRLLIGATTSTAIGGIHANLQLRGATADMSWMSLSRSSVDSNAAALTLGKDRAGGIVNNGDSLGSLLFYGHDGVMHQAGASISATVDSAPGANSMPTSLLFATTKSGSVSRVERARIDSNGNLGLGIATISPYANLRTLTVAGQSGAVVDLAALSVQGYGRVAQLYGRADGSLEISTGANDALVSRLVVNNIGNLGLGVTPSAWGAAYRAIEGGGGGSGFVLGSAESVFLAGNAYQDGTSWKYKTTNPAYLHGVSGNGPSSGYQWWMAPSGTAGAPITWTQAMTLDASGNLLVGATTPNSGAKVSITGGDLIVSRTGANAGIGVESVGGSKYYIVASQTGALEFYNGTANTTQAKIDASGNLGLGVTPSAWVAGSALQGNGGAVSFHGSFSALSQNVYFDGAVWRHSAPGGGNLYTMNNAAGHQWFVAPIGAAGDPPSWQQAMTLDASGKLTIKDFAYAKTAPKYTNDTTLATTEFVRAEINDNNTKWISKMIGELFYIRDDLPGADIPPTNNANYRYIKLTASDAYNTGALSGETVTGSAPLIVATATISLAGSPMNGQTVNLLNTERRFIRAGSSGTLQDDDFKSHTHTQYAAANAGYFNGGGSNYVLYGTDSATGATGGTETRPRNIGATAYMRIK